MTVSYTHLDVYKRQVYAWYDCTDEEYFDFLHKALDHKPHIIIAVSYTHLRAVQITGVPTSKVKMASSAANLLRRFTKY